MYRLVGCKNHIHTIEYMKMVKDGMPMNIREKLEAELKTFQDQLHYLETKSKETKSVISYNKSVLIGELGDYKIRLLILVQKRKLMMKQLIILNLYVVFPVMKII